MNPVLRGACAAILLLCVGSWEPGALWACPAHPVSQEIGARTERTGHAQRAPGSQEILSRIREAVGYKKLRAVPSGLLLRGDAEVYGLQQSFILRFTASGRFRWSVEGRLGETWGWDGEQGWALDWYATPRTLELEELELQRVISGVLTGYWLTEGSPFEVTEGQRKDSPAGPILDLRLKDGRLPFEVVLDRTSWLPVELRTTSASPQTRLTLRDYRSEQGVQVPHRLVLTYLGQTGTYRVTTVREASGGESSFAPPTVKPTTRFDRREPPGLEVRRTPGGCLLVHPQVDGKDAGWFLLDSGSWITAITARAADRLGLDSFGQFAAIGIGGTVRTTFRGGTQFTLGPLAYARPVFVQLDLGSLSRSLGTEVSGVCGYDLFSRCVVAVDGAVGTVELRDPQGARPAAGEWRRLHLNARLPCLPCRFESDREDLFMLDTGFTGAVSFEPAATRRYGLLEGRATRAVRREGIGGIVEQRTGKLAWLELGGRRFEQVDAGFRPATPGAYATPFFAGHIGMDLLGSYRLVFDYSRLQVALQQASGR